MPAASSTSHSFSRSSPAPSAVRTKLQGLPEPTSTRRRHRLATPRTNEQLNGGVFVPPPGQRPLSGPRLGNEPMHHPRPSVCEHRYHQYLTIDYLFGVADLDHEFPWCSGSTINKHLTHTGLKQGRYATSKPSTRWLERRPFGATTMELQRRPLARLATQTTLSGRSRFGAFWRRSGPHDLQRRPLAARPANNTERPHDWGPERREGTIDAAGFRWSDATFVATHHGSSKVSEPSIRAASLALQQRGRLPTFRKRNQASCRRS